jgi:hypothetical protein
MTQPALKKDTEQKREDFLYVPYGQTVHGEEEINAVLHVLRTSTQMGKHVREMEANIASSFDKKYGVMVNSGSSALYLAIESLALPKGSEVITPVLTFSTTVACLVKNGLVPAFVDCEADTYCIDVNKIEAASSSVFVSGWRPAIGWIGVAAMGYQFLLYPLFQWAWKYLQAMGWVPVGMDPPPVLEADQLWVILSGILGIAGMRSFEKTKGVASK